MMSVKWEAAGTATAALMQSTIFTNISIIVYCFIT